jgi:uncharacterized protein YjdB
MKKQLTKKFLILLLGICAIFGTCKFDYDAKVSDFVPVESVTGVPTGGVVGYKITLNRSVYPSEATNKTIVWSIEEDGGTGAALDRNKLTAAKTGIVKVKAVIKDGKAPGTDFTAYFNIVILDEYLAVNSIQDIPSKISVGSVTLTGTVKPSNAVNRTIIWELKDAGTTGATLDGDVLTTTAIGKLTLTAIVKKGAGPDTDYRQDLEIRVAPISVTSITGVATGCMEGNYILFGIVSPRNATFKNITWEVKDPGRTTGAMINGDVLTTTSVEEGSVFLRTIKVTAVVKDGIDLGYDYIQDFDIQIWRYHFPVLRINELPKECRVGDYTLSGSPYGNNLPYLINKTIIWEVLDAGETGAVIDGNVLTTTAPGTVTITAIVKDGAIEGDFWDPPYTILDYTQEFEMEITP